MLKDQVPYCSAVINLYSLGELKSFLSAKCALYLDVANSISESVHAQRIRFMEGITLKFQVCVSYKKLLIES